MSFRWEVLNVFALCQQCGREGRSSPAAAPADVPLCQCPTGEGQQGDTQIHKVFPIGSNRGVEGGKVRVPFLAHVF